MATRTRHDRKPVEELSDRQLRDRLTRAQRTIAEIDAIPAAEAVRGGKADSALARYEAAIETVVEAEAVLAERRAEHEHRSLSERLTRRRALERGLRQEHPAMRSLDSARRFAPAELRGETLVADRLTEDDAKALETLVKRKRAILAEPVTEPPWTDEEKAMFEALLEKAAAQPGLFERKRREAQATTKLGELKDSRRVANLPKRPLYAEPGSVSLPRFAVHDWLVGDSGRNGDWSLMDVGLLVGLLGAFANDDASLFVGGRWEGEGDDRTLVVPGGIGSDLRMHGAIAGSPLESGSGFVRVRSALATLTRNQWIEVEQTVGELRIRLGDRARKINEGSTT